MYEKNRISTAWLIRCRRGLAIMSLWLLPLPVVADTPATPPISAETRIDSRLVTIGDVITYSIVVRHEPGFQVLPPDPMALFEQGFEYIDQGTSDSKNTEGQLAKTFWFKFRADKVGFYNLSEVPVEFTAPSPDNPAEAIPGILQAPKEVIEVRSVLFQEDEPHDIKDIKPIIGAGENWQKYLRWALGGLAALAIFGILLWWAGRSRTPDVPVPSDTQTMKPHETALLELNQLMQKNLIERGQVREHYFEFSEIFRRYLGTLLSVPALDWTTEEITAYVSRSDAIEAGTRNTILSLLPETDQIKFAKAPVERQTALQHVQAVKDFVRDTTPEMTSKFQVKSPITT